MNVVFFQVASLFSTGVDNEKSLELTTTKYPVAQWHDHAKHSGLNSVFLLSKNESVLNILVYFLEQFQRFSRGLQPLENL